MDKKSFEFAGEIVDMAKYMRDYNEEAKKVGGKPQDMTPYGALPTASFKMCFFYQVDFNFNDYLIECCVVTHPKLKKALVIYPADEDGNAIFHEMKKVL